MHQTNVEKIGPLPPTHEIEIRQQRDGLIASHLPASQPQLDGLFTERDPSAKVWPNGLKRVRSSVLIERSGFSKAMIYAMQDPEDELYDPDCPKFFKFRAGGNASGQFEHIWDEWLLRRAEDAAEERDQFSNIRIRYAPRKSWPNRVRKIKKKSPGTGKG